MALCLDLQTNVSFFMEQSLQSQQTICQLMLNDQQNSIINVPAVCKNEIFSISGSISISTWHDAQSLWGNYAYDTKLSTEGTHKW